MTELYINRKLYCGEQVIYDRDLYEKSGVLVLLAEPGAGKTDLLNYLGRTHQVERVQASVFLHSPTCPQSVLIIDALDEVARINEEKINEILVRARTSGASKIILASRSYVWDEARNNFIKDCFGILPTILRLEPFDRQEQYQLFVDHLPEENFELFCEEVGRFDLLPLLGNPQFLRLFADAYIQSNRRFTSKKQIYADAVFRLGTESDQKPGFRDRPQTDKIVRAAGEAFAKLLLSGATGVSATEPLGDDSYPYLNSITSHGDILTFALNTRLFKPTPSVNKHEPVHRIVAEYCAADYLVKHIENSANAFSIKRCLSVIAPNGIVRGELRGMLGWIASLGGPLIQKTIIDLDPYAVFVNGDASQLAVSSKRRLLKSLELLAAVDPYFRHMDLGKSFSVSGFFSNDILEDVRPLLSSTHRKTHLRGLLLELLYKSDIAPHLEKELRAILYDPCSEIRERQQACKNLSGIHAQDEISDLENLIIESSPESLKIAAQMVSDRGFIYFGADRVLSLTKALSQLYPNHTDRKRVFESRYFIQRLFGTFSLFEVTYLLNNITASISCVCQKKEKYNCLCRNGISKIAGHLLDRYFEIMIGPYDPRQVGGWTKPLHFEHNISPENSTSVQVLRLNHGLRQAIQVAAFCELFDIDEIRDEWLKFVMNYNHSGIRIRTEDIRILLDCAIKCENKALWEFFIPRHDPYSEHKGPDQLRSDSRIQARQSTELLKIWMRVERNNRKFIRDQYVKLGRSNKNYKKRQAEVRKNNFASLQQDRTLIEAGRHWGWLKVFARQYLYAPEKTEDIVENSQTLENALLNCFDFLTPHIPTLEALSHGQGNAVVMVLEAACLAKFRENNSLESIPSNILQLVKAYGVGGDGYEDGEDIRFEAELDRLSFPMKEDAIRFLKTYIEPQFARTDEEPTSVYILDRGEKFHSIKGDMALDWLTSYPSMPSEARETLFNVAAACASRGMLNALIEKRCSDKIGASIIEINRRKFWLLRHFFFILPTSLIFWKEFSTDTNSIFLVERHAGGWSRQSDGGWPQLNANQLYLILEAYTGLWPKVDLPSSWGTGDPDTEIAYRFLRDIIYQIGRDESSNALFVFDKLLSDSTYENFHSELKSQKAEAVRRAAHRGFKPPHPVEVSKLIDENKIASVEDMRVLLIETLDEIQSDLKGAATNPVDVFYSGDKRVDENTARNRIVEMFERRFNALNQGVVIEHQMSDGNRCDFTVSTSINGSQAVLVTEVKGQWHKELYTAAYEQLAKRYMIHPGAADQGVYLVLWFGGDETIAGVKDISISSADQLHKKIIQNMPESIARRIDVYVLDVHRKDVIRRKRTKKINVQAGI